MTKKITQSGYSYKITITAEELSSGSVYAGGSVAKDYVMNPPQIKDTRAYSLMHGAVGRYPSWAFLKIVEPRFNGTGTLTGVPVNFPDMISEQHMIGVLRSHRRVGQP